MPLDLPTPVPRVRVRRARRIDRYEIRDLWKRRLGFATEAYLDAIFDDEAGVTSFVAVEGEYVVGFVILGIIERTALGGHLKVGYADVSIDDLPPVEIYVDLHTICVDEQWEGRKIGSALFHYSLEFARVQPSVGAAYGISWRRRDAVDSSALFETFEFEPVAHVPNFYTLGENPRRACPDCDPRSCRCDATIYARSFQSNPYEPDSRSSLSTLKAEE